MDLESRLRGTRRGYIVEELFTNSLHFPLANIFLELLLEGSGGYLQEPDLYIILAAGLLQAVALGSWRYRGRPHPLLGNLIAPALYTGAEAPLEGLGFFAAPNHVAYWAFARAIGLLQAAQPHVPRRAAQALLVAEHVVRTCILLAMYAIFEALTDPVYDTVAGFLSDSAHQFLTLVIPLLGFIIGFARLTSDAYLHLLRETAGQLRRYSSWLLGPQLLGQAVADPAALRLQRRERCVLFMDIRGFTAWSEANTPDAVVELLNGYFATAERVLMGYAVVKTQFIGDEVMCVLAEAPVALEAARELGAAEAGFLAGHGLSAGIGLHRGALIEGVIGAPEVKSYTVIGDTVNTAKRVCDQAAGGEVLLTEPLRRELEATGGGVPLATPRTLPLKGKREPLTVYPIASRQGAPAA